MIIDTYRHEYIRPNSVLDVDAKEYEYLLFWISANGSPMYFLFEDFILQNRIKGSIINSESSNISKLFSKDEQIVKLYCEDITKNQADKIIEMLRAKELRRYIKDESQRTYRYQKLAVKSQRLERRESDFRYDLKIEIQEIDKNIY